MRYTLVFPFHRAVCRPAGVRRLFSSLTKPNEDEGFTRSIYCKPQFKQITKNGEKIMIPTGLVDSRNEPLGDQFVSLQMKLTYKHDLDLHALLELMQKRVKERNRRRQLISEAAVQHLGVDLSVAHMICNLGGRVQFVGHDKWFQRYAGLPSGLPRRYAGDLKLESIDLSGTNVVYEGFELLPELTDLRHLRLRRCVHVDDFCLSRVARVESLQLLDVAECPRLSSKGIATLAQLKNLRRLFIQNNPFMEDKELVCLMLEDHLPKLYIDGVNYLGELPDESRRKIVSLVTGDAEKMLPSEMKKQEETDQSLARKTERAEDEHYNQQVAV